MIPNYADHSANERTFLAWVRTVIAIEGFGLAITRLGNGGTQLWSEALMLAAGAFLILLAFARMRHVRTRIEAAERFDDDTLPSDTLLLLMIAALFALLAAFAIHVT
jgi:putative membrane protein